MICVLHTKSVKNFAAFAFTQIIFDFEAVLRLFITTWTFIIFFTLLRGRLRLIKARFLKNEFLLIFYCSAINTGSILTKMTNFVAILAIERSIMITLLTFFIAKIFTVYILANSAYPIDWHITLFRKLIICKLWINECVFSTSYTITFVPSLIHYVTKITLPIFIITF